MAKGSNKLMKLKSALKKMQSFKIGRVNSEPTNNLSYEDNYSGGYKDLHPVYVGKSRRRYLVSSETIEHPLFRELVERSSDDASEDSVTVGCEVVLFEHMLWMLENGDTQPESLEELVEFYAC